MMEDTENTLEGTSRERLFGYKLQEWFDLRYIVKAEFYPVKMIAYGAVGLTAAAFLTAIAAYVIK